MKQNVLLVVFDTARADVLGPYGAGTGASPVIDDLAGAGWAAPSAYAPSNWTLPSHASMFSGLPPRGMGLGVLPSRPIDVIGQWEHRSLASVLRRAGYSTRGVSANPWVSRAHGLDAGFDTFKLVRKTRRHTPDQGWRDRMRWWVESARARLDDGMGQIHNTLTRWMDEGEQPFFWFVNLMECHSPYFPPRPFNDLKTIERLRAARDSRRYTWHRGFFEVSMGRLDVPPRSMARLRHLYGQAVRSMDAWLGRCLEELDHRGLLKDTLVIVTSDHGENLGEGHLLGHILSLDDRLIRVPFIVAGPSTPPCPSLMTLTGVPRFIAEAVGLEDHPWVEEDIHDGIACAQTDGFTPMGEEALEKLMESWDLDAELMGRMNSSIRCATDGRFKLVREGTRERLFDLEADPLERSEVSEGHSEARIRLGAALEAAEQGEAEHLRALEADPGRSSEVDGDEAADLEERMRLLGYL